MKISLFESNKESKLKSFLQKKNSKNSAWITKIIRINKLYNLSTNTHHACQVASVE